MWTEPGRVVSSNVPLELLEAVDQAAATAGVTRSAFIRSVLEAAVTDPPSAMTIRATLLRAGFRRDAQRAAGSRVANSQRR
jgi:hypothetical protein